mmetsp:Transcript_20099/g.46215  ORF Transcript_20099/g.46215 Transcript_20099/m.46215 type:complete len:195 (+) Transcript_20099:83-667(+)
MATRLQPSVPGRCAKQGSGKFVAGVLLSLRRHARLRMQQSLPSIAQLRRDPIARLPAAQEPQRWSAIVPDLLVAEKEDVPSTVTHVVVRSRPGSVSNSDCSRSLPEHSNQLRQPTAAVKRVSRRHRLPAEQRQPELNANSKTQQCMPWSCADAKVGQRSSRTAHFEHDLREMDLPSFLQLEDFNEKFLSKESGH